MAADTAEHWLGVRGNVLVALGSARSTSCSVRSPAPTVTSSGNSLPMVGQPPRLFFVGSNALDKNGVGALANTAGSYKRWSLVTGRRYRRVCRYSRPTA